jgi:hypothetical protein
VAIGNTLLQSEPPQQHDDNEQLGNRTAGQASAGGRSALAKDFVKRYQGGESIRAIAASTGRSYGFIHRLLTESGVQLRPRGGARRRKKA